MTVGELDFSNFVELFKHEDPYSPVPTVAYTFLFLCFVLLSVGLMNLLVRKHPVRVSVFARGNLVPPGDGKERTLGTRLHERHKRLKKVHFTNRPISINQNSNLAPRVRRINERN